MAENKNDEILPRWRNESEYSSLSGADFQEEMQRAIAGVSEVSDASCRLRSKFDALTLESESVASALITELQAFALLKEKVFVLFWNLKVFVSCELACDGTLVDAKKIDSELSRCFAEFEQAVNPISNFLARAPEAFTEVYLKGAHSRTERFGILRQREVATTLLSDDGENLLTALEESGLHAWGALYRELSSHLRCELKWSDGKTEVMGLAQAAALTKSNDELTRRVAWSALQEAWTQQQASATAILNSLAGWRLEVAKKRSHTMPVDYLFPSLRASGIQRETLEVMMASVRECRPRNQRALSLMATQLGKKQLDPWDTLAGAPNVGSSEGRSFQAGFRMVRDSFAEADPEMGEFCDLMLKSGWIESRVLPNKIGGAHCTYFPKSRTPRVFQTYMGSLHDIRTLAHELGHAYHAWVQRDLSWNERGMSMTLSESASIFAETTFAAALTGPGVDADVRSEIEWQNAESAMSFLLNIPIRYEFERELYERRKKAVVGADELRSIMSEKWMEWYGPGMSAPDPMFWATKLHFSISQVSFYNYPYIFGYLFSLGLYARRVEEGPEFMKSYRKLLRDTGRMTAEELARLHLGEDITKPEFWNLALRHVPLN